MKTEQIQISRSTMLSAIGIAAAGVILFSSKAVMVKTAFKYHIDHVSLLLLRMLFALPFYLVVLAVKNKEWRKNRLTSKQVWLLLAFGILGYYLASYFDFKGLTYISASLERLVLFIYPTIVVLLSALFLKKKVTKYQVAAILITYIGLAIIFVDRKGIAAGNTENLALGVTLIYLSAMTYAAYLVGSNFLINQLGSLRFTTLAMIVACIAVGIHFVFNSPVNNLWQYPWEVYVISLAMAIFATVIPSFLISQAIGMAGAPTVAIVGSLGPVSTITLSYIFLGETLTTIQLIGASVVICGVFVVSKKRK